LCYKYADRFIEKSLQWSKKNVKKWKVKILDLLYK
jgi:hypothetical protein